MIAVTGLRGCGQQSKGWCVMREFFEIEMPDTAPYKEWLGMVGSMALAVLVGAILLIRWACGASGLKARGL